MPVLSVQNILDHCQGPEETDLLLGLISLMTHINGANAFTSHNQFLVMSEGHYNICSYIFWVPA